MSLDKFKEIYIPFIPPVIMFFLTCTAIYLFKKEKIYRYPSSDWLDVKKHPIPEDIGSYIATDGKKVETKYGIDWAPYGKIFFNKYAKTYITHWQPLPDVPKK